MSIKRAREVVAGDLLVFPARPVREVLSIEPEADPVSPRYYLITFRTRDDRVHTVVRGANEMVQVSA